MTAPAPPPMCAMFPVLLHPDLYRCLRSGGRAERARVFKTLHRLRDGHWGGGTRVKRLRGVGRPVYEARTDAGDRLLFTVVRSALTEHPDRLVSHLQIWDLVKHDDAERAARRNRSPGFSRWPSGRGSTVGAVRRTGRRLNCGSDRGRRGPG